MIAQFRQVLLIYVLIESAELKDPHDVNVVNYQHFKACPFMTPIKIFELKDKENKNQRLKHYSSKFLFCCCNYHVQCKNYN